jgi:hypothetical protein
MRKPRKERRIARRARRGARLEVRFDPELECFRLDIGLLASVEAEAAIARWKARDRRRPAA